MNAFIRFLYDIEQSVRLATNAGGAIFKIAAANGASIAHYFEFARYIMKIGFAIFFVQFCLIILPLISQNMRWKASLPEDVFIGFDTYTKSSYNGTSFFYGSFPASIPGYSVAAAWLLCITFGIILLLIVSMCSITEEDLRQRDVVDDDEDANKDFKVSRAVFSLYDWSIRDPEDVEMMHKAAFTEFDILTKLSRKLDTDERTTFQLVFVYILTVFSYAIAGGNLYGVWVLVNWDKNSFTNVSNYSIIRVLAVPGLISLSRYVYPRLLDFIIRYEFPKQYFKQDTRNAAFIWRSLLVVCGYPVLVAFNLFQNSPSLCTEDSVGVTFYRLLVTDVAIHVFEATLFTAAMVYIRVFFQKVFGWYSFTKSDAKDEFKYDDRASSVTMGASMGAVEMAELGFAPAANVDDNQRANPRSPSSPSAAAAGHSNENAAKYEDGSVESKDEANAEHESQKMLVGKEKLLKIVKAAEQQEAILEKGRGEDMQYLASESENQTLSEFGPESNLLDMMYYVIIMLCALPYSPWFAGAFVLWMLVLHAAKMIESTYFSRRPAQPATLEHLKKSMRVSFTFCIIIAVAPFTLFLSSVSKCGPFASTTTVSANFLAIMATMPDWAFKVYSFLTSASIIWMCIVFAFIYQLGVRKALTDLDDAKLILEFQIKTTLKDRQRLMEDNNIEINDGKHKRMFLSWVQTLGKEWITYQNKFTDAGWNDMLRLCSLPDDQLNALIRDKLGFAQPIKNASGIKLFDHGQFLINKIKAHRSYYLFEVNSNESAAN
jgi:hypothetical protein